MYDYRDAYVGANGKWHGGESRRRIGTGFGRRRAPLVEHDWHKELRTRKVVKSLVPGNPAYKHRKEYENALARPQYRHIAFCLANMNTGGGFLPMGAVYVRHGHHP